MVTYPNETHNSVRLKAMYDGIKFNYSGYSNTPISFHPMNGILLKDKPTPIVVLNSNLDFRYTTDGTEPDQTSDKLTNSMFAVTVHAHIVLKAFSTSVKYDYPVTSNFLLVKALLACA